VRAAAKSAIVLPRFTTTILPQAFPCLKRRPPGSVGAQPQPRPARFSSGSPTRVALPPSYARSLRHPSPPREKSRNYQPVIDGIRRSHLEHVLDAWAGIPQFLSTLPTRKAPKTPILHLVLSGGFKVHQPRPDAIVSPTGTAMPSSRNATPTPEGNRTSENPTLAKYCKTSRFRNGTSCASSRENGERESKRAVLGAIRVAPSRHRRPARTLGPCRKPFRHSAKQSRPSRFPPRAVIAPESRASGLRWWRRRNMFRIDSQSVGACFVGVFRWRGNPTRGLGEFNRVQLDEPPPGIESSM
jgi:hypothetical protein